MKKGIRAFSAIGMAVSAAIAGTAWAQEADENLEEVLVIGSRIPRIKAEGPAPITTIDASQTSRRAPNRWTCAVSDPITRWFS
jgi:hypothetical protein